MEFSRFILPDVDMRTGGERFNSILLIGRWGLKYYSLLIGFSLISQSTRCSMKYEVARDYDSITGVLASHEKFCACNGFHRRKGDVRWMCV